MPRVLLASGSTHILASSRRIFNEKQHLIALELSTSVGLFSSHAVSSVSWAESNAMVPNSSQYRTTDVSVRI